MRTISQQTLAAAFMLAITFTLQTAFAAVPKNCTDEIAALSKRSGFDMQGFAKDLVPAVAKAKAQAKLPFGKPKDSDRTSTGMSFGCLKVFPESPGEIQSLLKDVSQNLAKDAATGAAGQLGTAQLAQAMQPQDTQQAQFAQTAQPQQNEELLSQDALPQPTPPPFPQYQQQAQPQYIPPPPQYYIPPPQPVLCKCEGVQQLPPENFSNGQRWGTWAVNTVIPGIGSAVIMNDYAGMGIQFALAALGWTSVALGANGIDELQPIGSGLLFTNFIFNIARANSYNKPSKPSNYRNKSNSRSSGKRYSLLPESGGFGFALLPSRSGETMPYIMYSGTF